MFLVNEIQVADRLERVRDRLALMYAHGDLTRAFEDGYVFALDEVWNSFWPDERPAWHYTQPEEDPIHELQYAEF